jgi:hypothetical protein
MRVQWQVPVRDGQLTDSQLVALAPRIAGLRAAPDSFALDASTGLPLSRLMAVFAVDDSGRVLGELRNYAFSVRLPLALDSTGMVRARGHGSGYFQADFPTRFAGDGRTRYPALVHVTITDSSGVLSPPVEIPRGTAVVQGVVRDADGTPLVYARVQVLRVADGATTPIATTHSDPSGHYRVPELPAGQILLVISVSGRDPSVTGHVIADGGTLTHDARLLPRAPTPVRPQ